MTLIHQLRNRNRVDHIVNNNLNIRNSDSRTWRWIDPECRHKFRDPQGNLDDILVIWRDRKVCKSCSSQSIISPPRPQRSTDSSKFAPSGNQLPRAEILRELDTNWLRQSLLDAPVPGHSPTLRHCFHQFLSVSRPHFCHSTRITRLNQGRSRKKSRQRFVGGETLPRFL